MIKTINTKKLAKILKDRQYGSDNEVECYCPNCEGLVTFRNVDVACPFYDPECHHDGWKCEKCGAEYEWIDKGIERMIDYNKERSISEKMGNTWITRKEMEERKTMPDGFDKCWYCGEVTNQMGGKCSNCYL